MNGSCSTGELGAESGRLQAWALWKLSSGRPGWTKGRCPAVRSCSPSFLTHGHVRAAFVDPI